MVYDQGVVTYEQNSSAYLPITIRVMSWVMTFMQDRWIFKPSIKDVFITIERFFKLQKVLLQGASERKCAADIFFVCGCFWKHFNVFY